MDDRELKKLFERIEISIAVQQPVLLAYAKRGNQTINRLAHGVAAAPQRPIISHRVPRQVESACYEHFQLD